MAKKEDIWKWDEKSSKFWRKSTGHCREIKFIKI